MQRVDSVSIRRSQSPSSWSSLLITVILSSWTARVATMSSSVWSSFIFLPSCMAFNYQYSTYKWISLINKNGFWTAMLHHDLTQCPAPSQETRTKSPILMFTSVAPVFWRLTAVRNHYFADSFAIWVLALCIFFRWFCCKRICFEWSGVRETILKNRG